jgi:diguanylate cyclase (GGDEF)-like protein
MLMTIESYPVSQDPWLLAISIVSASFVAYVALRLGERVTQSRGRARGVWLVGAATALGTGIWSMHFTGMLAFSLPVPIDYDVSTVLFALFVAIVLSAVALYTITRPFGKGVWLAGGLAIGLEIASMEYIGMLAMRTAATPVWDVSLVLLCGFIAVVSSLFALQLIFDPRATAVNRTEWRRLASAAVFGISVGVMHESGMAAATFYPAPYPAGDGLAVDASALGSGAISLATIVVLALALAIAAVDRRLGENRSALKATRDRLQAVIESSPVILFALNEKGIVKMAEGRDLGRLVAFADDAVGQPFDEVFAEVPEWIDQAKRAFNGEEFVAIANVGGAVVEMHWTAGSAGDDRAGVIAVGTDITERRRAEEALRYQAFHDFLTGLPNRAAFSGRLASELEDTGGERVPLALAVLDLNRFKLVNDTLGHEVGDALLVEMSDRLRATVDERYFSARLGGDEFAVVMPGATQADAEAVAAAIGEALKVPFEVEATSLEMSAAIGIALYPDHALDATTLLRHADVAMYVAKRAGIGYAVYEIFADVESEPRAMMEHALRKAIANDELVLHYQPTVDLRLRRVTEVEALVRWNHATMGRLAPDRFIPIAEETGLILPMTRWVLDRALRTVAEWTREGLDLRIAVNLSAHSLRDSALPRVVERLLAKHGVAANRLTLEITETALMENMDITRHILAKVHALGVMISVDDFGTGYSSLAYLAQLPVDEIKIDRSFVMKMQAEKKDAEIVRWISGLGHVLGLRVVAEGVETESALATIVELGCDVAQGYYFTRPLPADDLVSWLATSPWTSAVPLEPQLPLALSS